MDNSEKSVNEEAQYFSSWTAEDILRAVINELHQPVIVIRGFCQILLNSEDSALSMEKRKELLGYILKRIDGIDETLKISVKALNLQEANSKKK